MDAKSESRASTLSRLSNFSQHESTLHEIRRYASNLRDKRDRILSAFSDQNDQASLTKSWAATGAIETGSDLRCICSARIGEGGEEENLWTRFRDRIKALLGRDRNVGHAFYIRNKTNGRQLWVGRRCLLELGTIENWREARALISQFRGEICPICWNPAPCSSCIGKERLKDPLYINGKVCMVCKRRAIRASSDDIACVPCSRRALR
jgi:hypothetical protein